MGVSKSEGRAGARGEPLRRRVLDAAERLLREGRAEFSMRDLATAAAVSFATPFNQFGGKPAIMHALSTRRIDTMKERFAADAVPADAPARVLRAIDVAVAVMLEAPEVNRAVMGSIGTAAAAPGQALRHSTSLWRLALGDGAGLAVDEDALGRLAGQLAFAFRGVLSFWTAGELGDEALRTSAREVATTLLAGVQRAPSASAVRNAGS